MRLTAIKLAGFKSFVDPSTLDMRSNLTGVVGPNGCGKSNVIDAVRWVTGESNARQLRGEALEDVIFNGSKARKPVGRAAVELRFDNSDGKLGGQFAAFTEISVRRELARDSGSRYFINGARARRRDVVDLFLGTGLGGRSNYAVIEQGAVNRLIEARPEDMRQVLEEAAGISRYKERRRETENRMRHTRDNLERLDDVIGEVSQRLATLQRQAASAEKYKRYKTDERRLEAELLALRWATLDKELEARQSALRAREDDLRRATSVRHEAETTRERQAAAREDAAAGVQQAQAVFYDAQSRAQRIAQALTHAREIAALHERERADLAERKTGLDQRDAVDAANERQATADHERSRARHAEMQRRVETAGGARDAAECAVRAAEAAWESHNAAEHNPIQQLDAERSRARYGQQRVDQLLLQRDKRAAERKALAVPDIRITDAAESELAEKRSGLAADQAEIQRQGTRLETLSQQINATESRLDPARAALAEYRAALASARKIQQAVLREDDATLAAWLEHQGHAGATGVARHIRVEPAWQLAAQAALGPWLRGFLIDAVTQQHAQDWPDDSLVLIERAAPQEPDAADHLQAAMDSLAGAPSLARGMTAPDAVRAAAADYFVVEDLATALARRDRLAAHQRLVTLDGCCVGPHSLTTPARQAAEHGVLARENEIAELAGEIEGRERACAELAAALDERREQHRELRARRQQHEHDTSRRQRALDAEHAECQAERLRVEQLARRGQEIDAELTELGAQLATATAEHAAAEQRVTELAAAAECFTAERERVQAQLAARRRQLEAARADAGHAVGALRDLDAALARSAAERDRLAERRADAARSRAELAARLAAFDNPPAGADTAAAAEAPTPAEQEAALADQQRAERELRAARGLAEQSDTALRQSAEAAMQTQQAVDQARETLQQARIDAETAAVRRSAAAEQIHALDQDPRALADALPRDADAARWSEQLEALARRIQRLGAINLAAIEEYEAESERDRYLQDQRADLAQALATLESAIAKIDRETRSRFKTTFQQVNARFAALFPELFGGGEAELALTEDDWLYGGVRVTARPPGKRNASIQMLSGGEKALAAVALLFALFELNPAPFCMLDEIDAPLDDANVARFCKLVAAMSERVQFIVITHNKLTMELAERLHGVTMAEPGVSRLVSVDIDQALDMAG